MGEKIYLEFIQLTKNIKGGGMYLEGVHFRYFTVIHKDRKVQNLNVTNIIFFKQ